MQRRHRLHALRKRGRRNEKGKRANLWSNVRCGYSAEAQQECIRSPFTACKRDLSLSPAWDQSVFQHPLKQPLLLQDKWLPVSRCLSPLENSVPRIPLRLSRPRLASSKLRGVELVPCNKPGVYKLGGARLGREPKESQPTSGTANMFPELVQPTLYGTIALRPASCYGACGSLESQAPSPC